MKKYLDDIFFVLGAGLIVYATYLVNLIAAIYAAGIVLIVFGVLVGIGGKRES